MFFRTKEKLEDLSCIGVDIHSHILPLLDDGCSSIDEALTCIKSLVTLGYRKLIFTPHVIVPGYNNSKEDILESLKEMQEVVAKNDIIVELDAGAEYYLDYELLNLIENDLILPFGKKKHVLFELPYSSPSDYIEDAIILLNEKNYIPVLAHPERYFYWHNNFNYFKQLKDKGVLFQLNLVSLSGAYNFQAKKMAEKLVENNMIEIIGSDAHGMASVNLMEKMLNNKFLIQLINSGKLINNSF